MCECMLCSVCLNFIDSMLFNTLYVKVEHVLLSFSVVMSTYVLFCLGGSSPKHFVLQESIMMKPRRLCFWKTVSSY